MLLDVRAISKSFDGIKAVLDVSFSLIAGELLAMIGPNGAGKTTCFNMVGGQLKPDSGTITLNGTSIAGLPPEVIVRTGVGRTFQVAQSFVSMSVIDNVQMALIAHHGAGFSLLHPARSLYHGEALALLELVGMKEAASRNIRELAYGDVKRLELAVALASAPKLLLMDEPTAGMAAAEREALMRLTRDLAKARGIGVLFTEHDMDAVFSFADRILVLVNGRLIAEGPPASIRHNEAVRQAYLGATGLLALEQNNAAR